MRLCVKNDKAELDHMWVVPERMGTGVGKELFLAAMQKASELNLSSVEICSDPNAEGFYQKMGAIVSVKPSLTWTASQEFCHVSPSIHTILNLRSR
jgi:N-acetylglutamate synthase-like GNAT family acetyltransferase